MMSTISVYGKEMTKIEFFEYFLKVFVSLENGMTKSKYDRIARRIEVMRNMMRSKGWLSDYEAWLAGDGAELEKNLLKRS